MVTETLIERLSQKAADLIASKPVLPPRDFPLVLRPGWRIDNCPRMGRLRALAAVAMKRNAAGYHCPANLQIITAAENLSKGCWFDDWAIDRDGPVDEQASLE